MRVKALTDGFYGGARRRAGHEFDVAKGTKSSWFVPVAESEPVSANDKPSKKKGDKSTPETLSEMSKTATPQELEVI